MKTYAVTGAASGIGRAIADRLAREGNRVLTIDLSAAEVAADLRASEGRASAIAAVSQAAMEGLDGLVVAAGIGPHFKPTADIVRLNYYGAIACIEGLKSLLAMKRGAVLIVSSNSAPMGYAPDFVAALMPDNEEAAVAMAQDVDGQTAYGGAKLALTRWMRAQSASFASAGMRINAIAPGYTVTAMTEEGLKDPEFGPLMADFKETIPLGRAGTAEDQAAAACFLLSEEAAYICGAVLFVDGGHDALFRPNDF